MAPAIASSWGGPISSSVHDLPHVWAAGQSCAASRRAIPEHDPGVALHPQALVDQALGRPRLGLAPALCAHVQTRERLRAHADRERILGCLTTHVVVCSLTSGGVCVGTAPCM